MRCKTAQLQMALAVGEDLSPSAAVALQTHLADCSTCQQVWKNQERSFSALQLSRAEPVLSERGSVWPSVASRIQQRRSAPRRAEFNGWIAGLAALAASVLVFVFTLEEPWPTEMAEHGHGPAIAGTMVVAPSESARDFPARSVRPVGSPRQSDKFPVPPSP